MSETNGSPAYTLQQFPEKLAVVRLAPGAEVPAWAESSSVFSITATATETSLVCATRSVPTKVPSRRPLTAFAVQGPIDEEQYGVLAALLAPLAEEGISIFSLSTFDTDWILVPTGRVDDAIQAWRRRGHTVAAAVPVTPARQGSKPKKDPKK
ncbi:ACT domain-containing protein [Nocardioides sp. AE5]|uniref:ACT domain-containing protein n=1 Tax=Nocardioides sp. AE5 TaxID=2962573 RepID=UPI0028822856|nr:ACT domain-containing protein [Nocardioides sp. AE5]MDT0201533.1 ACT domain-containing protein [Nocardioides sp. AE5]